MADSGSKRKPRIRKTAPTIRQAMEASQKTDVSPNRKLRAPKFSGMSRAFKAKPFVAIRRVLAKIMPRYFVNSWREVRQVTWPTRRETWRLTLAVFVFSIIFGALVAVVDKGLDEIFKHTVIK